MPIYAPFGGFWATFPPNDVTHRPNPKRTVLGLNYVIVPNFVETAAKISLFCHCS